MITCGRHGRVNGFIVCKHVIDGAPCSHFLDASPDEADDHLALGEALCAACTGGRATVDDVKLVCESCLNKIMTSHSSRVQ